MGKQQKESTVPDEMIMNKIFLIRNQKVMIDRDLAELYGVETKRLKEAVRRNIERFPEDFMFQMTKKEFEHWRTHFASSSWGGSRYVPMAFTEQGVAMLSSVLNSDQAIEVNIQIMRIFVKMRGVIKKYKEILKKIEKLETEQASSNKHIGNIYKIIKELMEPQIKNRNKIGYKISSDK